jgi:plastocyanin
MSRKLFSYSIALALLLPSVLFAADGTIKIKFKLDGDAPKPAKLKIDKDEAFCGPKMLVDESLIVGKDKGIANIAVYMYVAPGAKAPTSEAALKALPKEVKMDNLGCRYEPRMIAVHTSQTVIFGNPDPMGHNVKGDFFKNGSFNDLIPGGGSTKRPFTKNEVVPMPVACAIHSWMGGHVLVRDNPYFDISDESGEVTIANVPEGKHTFTIWQERAGFVTKAKQKGKDVAWKLGRMEVNVKGDTDLGEFLIAPSSLEKK